MWRAIYIFIAQLHRGPSKIGPVRTTQHDGGKPTFHSMYLIQLIYTKLLRAAFLQGYFSLLTQNHEMFYQRNKLFSAENSSVLLRTPPLWSPSLWQETMCLPTSTKPQPRLICTCPTFCLDNVFGYWSRNAFWNHRCHCWVERTYVLKFQLQVVNLCFTSCATLSWLT